jgi:hypothetical protein
VSYGGEATTNHVADMDQYIDTSAQTVSSATGELQLDYGRGLCSMNAPKAQGTCGFHTGAPERLADVTIVCSNEYAAITVVPLDDQAIRESTNLLVQVGTVSRPYGWRTEPAEFEDSRAKQTYAGTRIVSVGGPPWNVERADIRVAIGNVKLRSVHALDANGMATGTVPARREKGVLVFTFPADALYVVVR